MNQTNLKDIWKPSEKYKVWMHSTLLKNGHQSYGTYSIKSIPAIEVPKHILDFMYAKCLDLLMEDCEEYIKDKEETTPRGRDYFGWTIKVDLNYNNHLEVRAFNSGVTLKYEIQTIEDLRSFMEVLSSLQYEVA